jgi:hypothetical protein
MPLFPEFPEYDDNLTIPDGWVDVSWHNNACPSISKSCGLLDQKLAIVIWCDYKDPTMRDWGIDSKQFAVSIESTDEFGEEHYEPKGWFDSFDDAMLYANALYSKKVVKAFNKSSVQI